MGRSIFITFTLEMTTRDASGKVSYCTPSEWRSKARRNHPGHGQANKANLGHYIEGFEASTREGGVNAHLGAQTVVSARVVRQATGEILATFQKGSEAQ